MLHEAAKRYFDSLGLEKLPSIKALKQEYAALSAENKKLYPDQKAARKEMIDLLTAKSNPERFLEIKIEQSNHNRFLLKIVSNPGPNRPGFAGAWGSRPPTSSGGIYRGIACYCCNMHIYNLVDLK
ncbi:MAG: hypothetical protein LUE89_10720 [Clostridiales bacterium]|nr:hypothetical protein [Clostridiales bacterium]